MNFHHNFSKESKTYLLEFLKVAEENKHSRFNDLKLYYSHKNAFQIDEKLKRELEEYKNKNIPTLDLTVDSDSEVAEKSKDSDVAEDLQELVKFSQAIQELEEESSKINESLSNDHDIAYAIIEILEGDEDLSEFILNTLRKSDEKKLDLIFTKLGTDLNSKCVINLASSIVNCNHLNISLFYLKHLFFKQILIESSDKVLSVFQEIYSKFPKETVNEFSIFIYTSIENDNFKLLPQFIDKFDNKLKSDILTSLISNNCDKLNPNCLNLIEILLNNQMELSSLNKLTELMFESAIDYKSDKNYGKLLMKLIQVLGTNLAAVEKPLKHIIGMHSSIWKSRLQKMFSDRLDESLLLSQCSSLK